MSEDKSRETMAALLADCEIHGREAETRWLLGMLPPAEQGGVVAMAARHLSGPAEPLGQAGYPADLEIMDYLGRVWDAAIAYLRQRSHVDELSERLSKAPTAELRAELGRARDLASERAGRLREIVRDAPSRPAEGAVRLVRNYFLKRAMDYREAMGAAARAAEEALPKPPEPAPPMPAFRASPAGAPALPPAPTAPAVPAPKAPSKGPSVAMPTTAASVRFALPFLPTAVPAASAPGVFGPASAPPMYRS
jgi:hypothetical protein